MVDEKDREPVQGDEDLSEYTVTLNGVEHQMMLNEEDAKRYGDDAKKGASSGAGGTGEKTEQPVKASGAQSKVQTAQNK